MTKSVVVLDYGSGNIRSALLSLQRLGAKVKLSSQPEDVEAADGLVVPGVGAFGSVMRALRDIDGPRLIERRLAGGRPVLGICVGMQVMFESGYERGISSEGLGQWPGRVESLHAPVLPHMGWSQVQAPTQSILFAGLEGERFYFVHSNAVTTNPATGCQGPLPAPLVSWAEHGEKFVAAVENGPLCATQFHPEKSGEVGAQLLKNWLRSL